MPMTPPRAPCRIASLLGLAMVWSMVAGAASLVSATPAFAIVSCNFGVSAISFGNAIDGFAATTIDTTGTLSISCSGGLPNTAVSICPNIGPGSGGMGGGRRLAVSGAATLAFDLFQDAARSLVWGSAWPGGSGSPPVLVLPLDGNGAVSATRTIYARAYLSSATQTGTYSSNFSGGASTFTYEGINIVCSIVIGASTATPSFTVSGTVVSSCSVQASDLDFGTTGTLAANIDAATTLGITCNAGTPYTIALNGGNANGGATSRKMSLGASKVTYGLYRDAQRTLGWGSAAGEVATETGSGNQQTLTVYGRVPSQPTPLSGTYSDVVVATVTY